MKVNINDILKDFKTLLSNKYSDKFKGLVLFGSQVSGKARMDSDYDFLVILVDIPDWKTEREISDLSFEIELKYNIVTDTHILAETEFNTLRGKQPIFVNAMQKGLYAL